MSGRYLPKAASLRAAGLAVDVVQQLIAASANRQCRKVGAIIIFLLRFFSFFFLTSVESPGLDEAGKQKTCCKQ